MGIFDALHIGYSGLSASQIGINTTSHNISNANTEGYSKQIATQKVNAPIHNIPGDVGNGTRVTTITRAHDEFVYTRLKSSAANVSYNEYMEKTLQEITTFTPDLDGLGIAQDLKDFFASWSDVAQNPADESSKIVLLSSMDSLTHNLNSASTQLKDLQTRLNQEFKIGIDKVNEIAKEIVELNKNINKVENSDGANANDLRDQRDTLELSLAKLLNIDVSKTNPNATGKTDQGTHYNINVGGFNLVDGVSFHPLRAEDGLGSGGLNAVYYVDQDQKKVDMTASITRGELGAILDLRGNSMDPNTSRANNSKIQDYLDNLDAFAKTLVQNVNSIYASSAQEMITTEPFSEFNDSNKLVNYDGITEGSFQIKVYDALGKEVASRAIVIDQNTSLAKNSDGTINPNSIVEQINKNSDDNTDNDGANDLDDLFSASIVDGALRIVPKNNGNFTIAVEDNGTNFAGRTGVKKLLDGDSAASIGVESSIKNNPSNIATHKAPIDGNSDMANAMVSLQYESVTFEKENGLQIDQTVEGFYRYVTSQTATDASSATTNKEAALVLNKTVTDEMKSVSGVDMDEELVNLMKYQTAYQANAKIITAIDKMLDTLLGMK